MAWKKVGEPIDIKKGEVGQVYIGTYKGNKSITTPLGPSVIYSFLDDEGSPFSLYGFTLLNRGMEAVPPDAYCRVTYLGKKKNKKNQDVNQASVEVGTKDPELVPANDAGPDPEIPF